MAVESEQTLFDHSNWRDGNGARREVARELVRASVDNDRYIDFVIMEFKHQVKWQRLDDSDRNRLNVLFTGVRKIALNWTDLPASQRNAFLRGTLPASSLAKLAHDIERKVG